MTEELTSLSEMQTWTLSDLPPGYKAIGTKWLFDLKFLVSEEIVRFKARLVAKGLSQRLGMDYDEVFAPVAKHVTIRFILPMAADPSAHLAQLDVSTAFLNGLVEEEIYCSGAPDHQDLKRITEFAECGNAYDFLLLSFHMDILKKYKDTIISLYKTRDLGEPSVFVGYEITRDASAGIMPPALTINGDNQAALSAWNEDILSSRLRHMKTRFHFLEEQSKKQGIRLPTAANMTDMFTKALPRSKFTDFSEQIGCIGKAYKY
eukprot:gene6275-biopygen1406